MTKMMKVAIALLIATTTPASAQLPGTENGEWRYLGGDAGHTRSSTLDQINASNFADLEQAWIWKSDNFGPNLDYFSRATPIYVDGIVYTVATPRRQVVAINTVQRDAGLVDVHCAAVDDGAVVGIEVRHPASGAQ